MSEEFSFDLDEKSIKNIKEAIGLDEIEARHQRFMNGTETIDDLINHIYYYKIKNNDGLDLELVEKKYYEKIVDLYNKEKEKNIELLTRLRADGLIERDKYWINKIKEALYNGTLDAKGWGCEDGAYCVEKQFKQLLEEGE